MQVATLTNLRNLGFSSGRCPVTREVAPNMTTQYSGFHISYNNHSGDYGCDTTALVLQGRVFFVLNGNHCASMVAAANTDGIQGCIEYFIQNIDQANMLSEHRMAAGVCNDPFSLYETTLNVIGESSINRIAQATRNRQSPGPQRTGLERQKCRLSPD